MRKRVCFVPEAPPPIKKNGEDEMGEASAFPYSEIYMSALNLGFTTEDLNRLTWARFVFFLRVKALENERASKKRGTDANGSTYREATQADIASLLL